MRLANKENYIYSPPPPRTFVSYYPLFTPFTFYIHAFQEHSYLITRLLPHTTLIYTVITHRLSRDSPTSLTVSPFHSTKYYINPHSVTIERPRRSPSRRQPSLTRPNAMPGQTENVVPPLVVRDMDDAERLVVEEFKRHVGHCTQCTTALEDHKDSLCERGHPRAVDVTHHLYCKEGKHFSVVDKENGTLMRVKLPRDADSVRNLLDAVEAGMTLKSPRRGRASPVRSPATSTFYVPSRRPVVEQGRPRSYSPEPESTATEIIERSPRVERSPGQGKRHVIVYQSPRNSMSRSPSSRGSLYSSDRERSEQRFESSRIRRRGADYRF